MTKPKSSSFVLSGSSKELSDFVRSCMPSVSRESWTVSCIKQWALVTALGLLACVLLYRATFRSIVQEPTAARPPDALGTDEFPIFLSQDPRFEVLTVPAMEDYPPAEFVIGVEINGEARAYAMSIMGIELGNDEIGGSPIAIAFCPLCQTAVVYSRMLNNQVLTLGHTWETSADAFMFFDMETRSVWLHGPGRAVQGELENQELDLIPSRLTTWESWKGSYPDTSLIRDSLGHDSSMLAASKYHGLSVTLKGQSRLYPFEILSRQGVINDVLGETPVVVALPPGSWLGTVFQSGNHRFEQTPTGIVDQTAQVWDMLSGVSDDQQLTPLAGTPWFVDRWREFYPKGTVYASPNNEGQPYPNVQP